MFLLFFFFLCFLNAQPSRTEAHASGTSKTIYVKDVYIYNSGPAVIPKIPFFRDTNDAREISLFSILLLHMLAFVLLARFLIL